MEILDNGIWVGEDAGEHHQFDDSLANAIVHVFKTHNVQSVVDVGCGLGLYTQRLIDNNINCIGVDGNPNTPTLTNGLCGVLDVSVPIEQGGIYEGVLCLEVGEHIPKIKQDVFIQNLVDFQADFLILSWAVPNQGGDGHLNELSNQTVVDLLYKHNYYLDYNSTLWLRSQATNCWWFKISLLVFRK